MKPLYLRKDDVSRIRLSHNPGAIHYLAQHVDLACWRELSSNPEAIWLLAQYPENIDTFEFSRNPKAVPYLERHLDKVDWSGLTLNPNPAAMALLEKHADLLPWHQKDSTGFDHIPCQWLSENPNSIAYFEKYPQHIKWEYLSKNPNAVHLLEQNPDKIDWFRMCANPAIFEYDYQAMSQSRPFTEELMQNRFHPKNMDKFINWGFE